jgi:hypothetical protein
MQAIIEVIMPVFLVVGFGYTAVWRGLFSSAGVDGLMSFTQNFAIPCLLFQAISTLDLSQGFDPWMMFSFYTGAASGFVTGLFGARYLFGRDWEDCVAIGFCCLFSNSLMIGLAITERAYGTDALTHNYALVALHSPFCYGLGITVMEVVRNRGKSPTQLSITVLRAMFQNALIIGIALGFVVNFSDINLPIALTDALDMVVRAALPAALFGMGGVLFKYRPDGDLRTIGYVCGISLLLHPVIVWFLGSYYDLSSSACRSAVITAAMPTGVNGYVFANMYGRARRVAASSVLLGTALSIFTISLWLLILP